MKGRLTRGLSASDGCQFQLTDAGLHSERKSLFLLNSMRNLHAYADEALRWNCILWVCNCVRVSIAREVGSVAKLGCLVIRKILRFFGELLRNLYFQLKDFTAKESHPVRNKWTRYLLFWSWVRIFTTFDGN